VLVALTLTVKFILDSVIASLFHHASDVENGMAALVNTLPDPDQRHTPPGGSDRCFSVPGHYIRNLADGLRTPPRFRAEHIPLVV
jgi:hypothetical protein